MFQVITEGGICRIDFSRNLKGIFMCKYDCNSNSYKFSSKFTFITFFSFHRNQKQESNFQQVGGLVTRNSFAFFYSESRSTSKVCRIQKIFIKRFSYVIPARIIVVPCFGCDFNKCDILKDHF